MKYASDSFSICSSIIARIAASPSSSYGWPFASAAPRATIEMTPASCAGPITADFAFGQLNMNRGSYARPLIP